MDTGITKVNTQESVDKRIHNDQEPEKDLDRRLIFTGKPHQRITLILLHWSSSHFRPEILHIAESC